MNGIVFSIEEFSTFDGPGIRMTVFLKGCPLKCSWCHNPEGKSIFPEYIKSPNGCLQCGACLAKAKKENENIVLTKESEKACPRGLIRRCGDEYDAKALTDIILKNAKILNMNGGGVTFSGGEPTLQSGFLLECIDLLKGKVNIAIQTCGYCSQKVFNELLNKADYFLYDLKLLDRNDHIRYCGVDNDLIIANYKTLAKSNKPFITRIPLIPGVTDTEKNIESIASFMSSLGVKEVEVLPYNKYAGAKYSWLLKEYKPDFDDKIKPVFRKNIFDKYFIDSKEK